MSFHIHGGDILMSIFKDIENSPYTRRMVAVVERRHVAKVVWAVVKGEDE